MGTIELIILVAFGLFVLYTIYSVFFSGKKKKEKKAKKSKAKKEKPKKEKKEKKVKVKKQPEEKFDGEKKIEKAIVDPSKAKQELEKPEPIKVEVKPSEQEEEPALELKKDAPKDKSFKIICKKSEIKINKKAIKADSRNPSVTKVFEKGKRIDGGEEITEEKKDNDLLSLDDFDFFGGDFETIELPNKEASSSSQLEHYGYREPTFKSHIASENDNLPNRTPRIKDRTNFKSHLVVSKDNNLSGIAGIGVAKAINEVESYTNEIKDNTMDMVDEITRDVYEDRNQSISSMMAMMRGIDYPQTASQQNKKTAKDKLKNIDAETLVIADAIIKRRNLKH